MQHEQKDQLHTHTHTHLTALFPGLPRWAGTRKVKPIWILLKQETVSGSSISWAICKSAPRSRQITTPAPHHSVFYRPDALPAAQPTASKQWRQSKKDQLISIITNADDWSQLSLLLHCNWIILLNFHVLSRSPVMQQWLRLTKFSNNAALCSSCNT